MSLLRTSVWMKQVRQFSLCSINATSNRACLGRPSRTKYLKQYKITLMQSDGSTIEARYAAPLHFVRLPLDLRTADENERRQRLALRKPQVKKMKEEVLDDNFDAGDYLKYFQK
ncbi:unnamed protein product [Bursaphelenchus xylophilus]|uniref:(pine wood nematode) hypothetical protein n=1 Tax=Bursaphelenchus xylophilus TaxID=6326 RepID=A0A1I7S389_BURXY|nr:unnamed protein product [Bursaphelenchus xylophilus]CAG9116141.1 unnamed protein product [Bursaphelenchus xylophilus]